jgi:D-glycero-D-manno-heptose 1,7-bisphosphate phosphatase
VAVNAASQALSRNGGRPAVFLDKDGTLLVDDAYNVAPERMRLVPDAGEALGLLGSLGLTLIIVSNQSGAALGRFAVHELVAVGERLHELFRHNGAELGGFYFCPHHPCGRVRHLSIECLCRKPRPGMLQRAAQEIGIDLHRSWMIGDILDDVEAGGRAGCRTIMIDCGNETQWRITRSTQKHRTPHFIVKDLLAAASIVARVEGHAADLRARR